MHGFRRFALFTLLLALPCAFATTASAADPGTPPTFTKTGPPSALAGEQITYQINLTNGLTPSPSAMVSDALPPGTVFISVEAVPADRWNCTGPPVGSGGTVTCQRLNGLQANAVSTFTIVARICPETACDTNIANQASFVAFDPPTTTLSNQVTTLVQSQANVAISKSGPVAAAAGSDITYTLNVNNLGPSNSSGTTVVDTLPAGWTVVSATPSVGSCNGVGTGALNCSLGTIGAANQCSTSAPLTAQISVVVHIPAVAPPGAATNTATVTNTNCLADPATGNNTAIQQTNVSTPNLGPGEFYPPTSALSTTKAGSVLFFSFYVSSPSSPADSNTRISITNTNPTRGIAVHLFFVDGVTCSVADRYICLTANQTISFLTSDIDPGMTGYLIAVAADGPAGFGDGGNTGCPISFNFLIGQASVKLAMSPRRQDEIEAESCAAEFGSPVPGCNPGSFTATLNFNGGPNGYNRLPRVLALDNIPSRADGNDTFLVINRIGGSLLTGGTAVGTLFGVLYDDAERPHSFSLSSGLCQLRGSLMNGFPRISPPFNQIIPAGQSGWLKLWAADDSAILGVSINRNDNVGIASNAFEGGKSLHKLRLTSNASLVVPVFPPAC
jgi:uncharacterized repeat protein (TIGR01451 family)